MLDATKLIPEEDHPARGHRQDGAQPQPRQLLRRDRAGRLPPRPRRAGHRLHQRSAAAGPAVLLHRHPAHPARRAELPRAPDQPAALPDAQLPARRRQAPERSDRARRLRAEQPRSGRAARERRTRLCDLRGAGVGRQAAHPPRELRRSLQPGAAVLPLDERAGAAPHHQRLRLRARQGRDRGDPQAHARPPDDHRADLGRRGRRSAGHGGRSRTAHAGARSDRSRRSRPP